MLQLRRASGQRIRLLLSALALTFVLLLPAIVNGGGFLFPDTTAYVRGADAVVVQATHHRSAWSDRLDSRVAPRHRPADSVAASSRETIIARAGERPIVLAGRSIYYGMLIYLSLLTGGFWPLIVLQGALTALAAVLTLERMAPAKARSPGWRPAALLLLPLLSAVGYFAAFMMPDLLAALAILASAHLVFAWHEDSWKRRLFWMVVLTLGIASHSATLSIIAGLTVGALVYRWLSRTPIAVIPLIATLVGGFVAEASFQTAVQHFTGLPPVRPPFLTARLIEDGPALTYLKRACGTPRFLLCRYRDRLPLPSDAFLWSNDPRHGVFRTIPASEQRQLAAEQKRFALAVFASSPLPTLASSLRATGKQLLTVGLGEFNLDEPTRQGLAAALPPAVLANLRQTRAYHGTMPTEPVAFLCLPLAVASLLLLAGLWRHPAGDPVTDRRKRFVAWIGAGILLNAALCGAVSGPHERYQTRLLWLLPLAAICCANPLRLPARVRRPA